MTLIVIDSAGKSYVNNKHIMLKYNMPGEHLRYQVNGDLIVFPG